MTNKRTLYRRLTLFSIIFSGFAVLAPVVENKLVVWGLSSVLLQLPIAFALSSNSKIPDSNEVRVRYSGDQHIVESGNFFPGTWRTEASFGSFSEAKGFAISLMYQNKVEWHSDSYKSN